MKNWIKRAASGFLMAYFVLGVAFMEVTAMGQGRGRDGGSRGSNSGSTVGGISRGGNSGQNVSRAAAPRTETRAAASVSRAESRATAAPAVRGQNPARAAETRSVVAAPARESRPAATQIAQRRSETRSAAAPAARESRPAATRESRPMETRSAAAPAPAATTQKSGPAPAATTQKSGPAPAAATQKSGPAARPEIRPDSPKGDSKPSAKPAGPSTAKPAAPSMAKPAGPSSAPAASPGKNMTKRPGTPAKPVPTPAKVTPTPAKKDPPRYSGPDYRNHTVPKYVYYGDRHNNHYLPSHVYTNHRPVYYRPIIPVLPLWYYTMGAGYRPFYYNPGYYYDGWRPAYNPYYPWWITGGVSVGVGVYVPPRTAYYYPATSDYDTAGNTTVINNIYMSSGDDGTSIVVDNNGQANIAPPPPPATSVLNSDMDLTAPNGEDSQQAPPITREQIDDAWKNMQIADSLFAANKVEDAMKTYQKIADDIPQMPDPWIRMAVGCVAQGDYNFAMDASNRGMTLSTGWPCSPFSLDYMYQQNARQKQEDLLALDTVAATYPDNSDLTFLTGMMYYFDGQTEKATAHLGKAKKLMPDLGDFVDPMLANLASAQEKK